MKKQILLFLTLVGIIHFSCDKRLDKIPDVAIFQNSSIITGEITNPELLITSRILNTGDGITKYGHIISTSDNQDNNGIIDDVFSDNNNPISIHSDFKGRTELVSEETYWVWAYAIDVHGRKRVGEPREFSIGSVVEAEFEILNNFCTAPCSIELNNLSKNADRFEWSFDDGREPIETLDKGSPGAIAYTKPGTYTIYLKAFKGGIVSIDSGKVEILATTFEKTYATSPINGIEGIDIVQLPDNSYLILGKKITNVFQHSDIVLIRLDVNGELMATQPDQLNYFDKDIPVKLIPISAGKFAVIGHSETDGSFGNDIFCLIIDSNGNVIGAPRYFGESRNSEQAFDGIHTNSGNIMIIGQSIINGESFPYFISVRDNLTIRNAADTIDTTNIGGSYGIGISEINSGEFLVAGITSKIKGDDDIFSLTVNGLGKVNSSFPPYTKGGNQFATVLTPLGGGEFIIGGTDNATNDIYLNIINNMGIEQTIFPNNNLGINNSRANHIIKSGKNLVIAGSRNNNAFLVSTDLNGNKLVCNSFGISGTASFNKVIDTKDCGYIAVGTKDKELFIIKTDNQLQLNDMTPSCPF